MNKPDNSIPQNTMTLHGNHLSVHRGRSRQRGGGRRGTVKVFSPQSQARLVEKMLHLDWQRIEAEYVCRFVTLTTPLEYWGRLPFVYSALDSMRRLFFDQGMAFAFTRKEYGEKRGMLHYHMLVFIPRASSGLWLPEVPGDPPGWVGRAWADYLQYQGNVRVEVTVPEHWERVRVYVAKYCAKTAYNRIENEGVTGPGARSLEDGGTGEGFALSNSHNAESVRAEDVKTHNGNRFWYVWGAESAPWAKEKTAVLDADLIRFTWRVRRVFRKVFKARCKLRLQRECLPGKGKGLTESEVRNAFAVWSGPTATKHIQRQVCLNAGVRYLSRGGFDGWRLWMGGQDYDILQRLITEGI